MAGAPGRDLRQVRDAEHLVPLRQPVQPRPDPFRRLPADARVHLVEDQRATGRVGGDHRAQRQHDAGELAAGSDARERPDVFPGIGREVELHPVDSPVRPGRLSLRRLEEHDLEPRALHRQLAQPALDGAGQLARRRAAAGGQRAGEAGVAFPRRRGDAFQRFEVALPFQLLAFPPQPVAMGDDVRERRAVAPLEALQLRQALLGRRELPGRRVGPAGARPQRVRQLLEVGPHRVPRREVRRELAVEARELLHPPPHPVEDVQRGAVPVVQLRVALGRQAVDPLGVGEQPPLGGQRLVLALHGVDLVDVAKPQRHDLGPLDRGGGAGARLLEPLPGVLPAREGVPHRAAQRPEVGVAIEQIEMGRRIEQRLMLVLAMDVQQPRADGPEGRGRDEPIVDEGPAPAPCRHLAAQHAFAAVGVLRHRLHHRPLRAGPHQARRCPRPPQQAQGAHQDRLAGAGLAGQDREAGVQLELQAIDDRQVSNAEKADHGPAGSRGPGSAIVS